DMGCGSGVITLELAQRGAIVTASDVSATAVAATQATLALNQRKADAQEAGLYGAPSTECDYIVSNPRFPEGIAGTATVTEALIHKAPGYLKVGGELWLVANHGLPYEPILRQSFDHLERVATNNRFVVWRARRA